MIKTFCDFCEREIGASLVSAGNCMEHNGARVLVTVNVERPAGYSEAHACHECIRRHLERTVFGVEDLVPVPPAHGRPGLA